MRRVYGGDKLRKQMKSRARERERERWGPKGLREEKRENQT